MGNVGIACLLAGHYLDRHAGSELPACVVALLASSLLLRGPEAKAPRVRTCMTIFVLTLNLIGKDLDGPLNPACVHGACSVIDR